jgi:hypothetical protein
VLAGRLCLLLLLAGIAAFLTLGAPLALAAETHALKGTLGPIPSPSGIAIDGVSGNVFVADQSSNSVEILGADGGAPSGVAVSKIQGFSFSEKPDRPAVAIDNSSTSPSKGTLYVTDAGENTVKKFQLNPVSEEYEPVGMLLSTPAFLDPLGVAVDGKGDVFVSDRTQPTADGTIIEFGPTGTEIERINLSSTSNPPLPAGDDLAFDSAGNLYVHSHFGLGVYRFAANQSGEIEPDTTPIRIDKEASIGIAIDQATDTLYVAEKNGVAQYSSSCVPVDEQCGVELRFGVGFLGQNQGVAASSITGDIYVSDSNGGDVAQFDSALSVVPDLTTNTPTEVKQTAATLSGSINAAGGPAASCEFQYVTRESFEGKGFEGAVSVPCSPAGPFTGSVSQPVKAVVGGLSAETAYVFRLRGSNENGPNFGEALSFATVGKPKIGASSIARVSRDGATVEGLVNPNGGPTAAEDTTYFIEFVSEADFQKAGYVDAVKVPTVGEAIGSGTNDVKVVQQLSDLSVFSTYHFRIVAENEAGEEIGPDKTFTTYLEQAGGLPDGRAYEQVTPPDKNGAAPSGGASLVQAAPGGGGLTYASGGGIPGSEGSQQYPTYLAVRGSDWTTRGLLPPAGSGSSAAVLGWTEDLSQAYVVQADQPGSPLNLLQGDSTTHSLQTIVAEGSTNISEGFNFVGAAVDGSVVVFESDVRLFPGGATKGFNTYAWDRESGELSLVGVLPTGLPPAKGSLAGSNETGQRRHNTQAQRTVSSNGSRVYFRDAGTGQLYLRENPTAGEENCADPAGSCTIRVSAPQGVPEPKNPITTFWAASSDGGKAFFTSSGKLTAEANTGPSGEGNDLYRYDAESGELVDLTPDAADPGGAEVQGVLGASEDGSYVYFAANGRFGTAPSAGDCSGSTGTTTGSGTCNLYLWHEGALTFVAQLQLTGDYSTSDSANWLSGTFAGEGKESTARVSADGQTLLFRSRRQLGSYESGGTPELYRYRVGQAQPLCVSCNPSNAEPVGPPTLRSIETTETVPSPASVLTHNLSASGNRVFFETPDKLVASDTNGDAGCPFLNEANKGGVRFCQDVYEWEATGTGTCESVSQDGGCLYLLSTGTSSEPSYLGDADREGGNAFFFTSQPLVGQDTDQIVDIYDARVGGGIASQNPPPSPVHCEGQACKEGTSAVPAVESPGSASFSGPGNKNPAHHHKKHHHKKHHHKKHHHKKHHHNIAGPHGKNHTSGKRG